MRAFLPALSLAATLLAAPLLTTPARAQSADLDMEHQADQLQPGQWVWAGEIAPAGPVTVHVDLSRQLVTVYRNGVRIGVSTTSTGRRGYETPTGVFTVLQKKRRHRSNLYSNAPMPYMIRLTWDGIALHGGAVRDGPASHGCIRLPMAFARELYRVMPMGGAVVVVGEASASAEGRGAGVLAPFGTGGGAENREPLRAWQSYSWRPSASPFGPVTIVMSLSDQHVVVVRNGVEIGRARASIPVDVRSPGLLERTDAAQWVRVAGRESAATPDTNIVERVRMPPQFQAAVQAAAAPGTTVLLTHARVVDDAVPADVPALSLGPDDSVGPAVPMFDMER